LLKMLEISPSASLHLRCIAENSFTHNGNAILPLVSAHFRHAASVDFRSFKVTVNCLDSLIAVAASMALPKLPIYHSHILEDDMESSAELTLSFDGLPEFDHLTQADILKRMCNMVPLSNLELLSISAPDMVQSVNWHELFQHCKNVTTVQVNGRGTASLLEALCIPRPPKPPKPPKPKTTNTTSKGKRKKGTQEKRQQQAQAAPNHAAGSSGASTVAAAFPKLRSLWLDGLNLDVVVPSNTRSVLFDVLLKALRSRKDQRATLETLHVDRCVITKHRANTLQKQVKKFCWDEDEGEVWDDYDDYDDYSSDFIEPGTRLEDFFTTQAEWEWFENYSDGY
jgi:hypothetical protein